MVVMLPILKNIPILIQLVNENLIRISKSEDDKCGDGPWDIGNNFVEFER